MTESDPRPVERVLAARSSHPGFRLRYGVGWDRIVGELHEKLVQIDPGYRVVQVKEKFGTLRFYLDPSEGASEDDRNRMVELVHQAEHLTSTTCECCGGPGRTRSGSWIVTLCDEHHEEQLDELRSSPPLDDNGNEIPQEGRLSISNRVGRKNPRNLYFTDEGGRDHHVGVVFDPADGVPVAQALNAAGWSPAALTRDAVSAPQERPEIAFDWVNDEVCQVSVGGKDVIRLNHDDHGWSGMESVRNALLLLAETLNLPVRVNGEQGV